MEGIAAKPGTGVHLRMGSFLKSSNFVEQTRFRFRGLTGAHFRKLSLSHVRAQQSKEEHATLSPASVLELTPAELKEWRESCEQGNVYTDQGIKIRRRRPNGPPSHDVDPSEFHLHIEGTAPRNILEEIIWHKDTEVSLLKESLPLDTLRNALDNAPPARDFVGALRASYLRTGLPALIAEVKKASPSRGVLRDDFNPVQIAQAYEAGGAACLSVLTDEKYFQGSFNNLEAVRNAGIKICQCPLLCKEFIIDAWQIYNARAKGADAVLLIASVLHDLDIKFMAKICRLLGMVALVEVHDEREMDRVLGIDGIKLIGINNRDLGICIYFYLKEKYAECVVQMSAVSMIL
ncbi:Indole-3-glycerol phosphate synthase [Nymphaea thermarum]|nr:Indole-3-glycerol phosphate synthase [Nymphaea thermarum]